MTHTLHHSDCLPILQTLERESIDLAYLDPPFFTQRTHSQNTRDRQQQFSFTDVWESPIAYTDFMRPRIAEVYRVLKPTGSIFVQCDHSGSYWLRGLLDELFGITQFQSEIIWYYRRWSSSQRGLLPSHQTIFFYSKTNQFKFFPIYEPYSPATNIDQLLQKRTRDSFGVSVYAKDEQGESIPSGDKRGVPLGDVWDIPYLNPKARERVGYPTQKPVLLLERILVLCTEPCDIVLDPFCGSGTTLVAASLMGRHAIGIDRSEDAIAVTQKRLDQPFKSESQVLKQGRASYDQVDYELLGLLTGLDYMPVQRNQGIDALVNGLADVPIPVRIQRLKEPLMDVANQLTQATRTHSIPYRLLIVTNPNESISYVHLLCPDIIFIEAPFVLIQKHLQLL
jgi:site-specific DNA-methyltransferase (adenine-specific)